MQLTLMRFMIIDTCEIAMNNHTCEIIDFISLIVRGASGA